MTNAPRLDDGFHLDGWTIVPRAHEMVRPGETVHVEPKPMAVLVYLAERAGQAVAREELMAAVWPGVVVSDHALNRCVSRLRKLLDDDARAPRVIETIPKAGYRLIAPVVTSGDSLGPPEAVEMVPTSGPRAPLRPEPQPRWRWLVGVLAGVTTAVGIVALVLLGRPDPTHVATRALTVAPGIEQAPAWSPDGTRLAYVHSDGGRLSSVFVRALAEDVPTQITTGHSDAAPAWSPDGDRLAFLRCEAQTCRVFAMMPEDASPQLLVEAPASRAGLAWSDASALIVGAAPPEAPGLVAVDLDTGERRRLTSGLDQRPRVSPDGRRVAFVRRDRSGQDLMVVGAEGGEPVALTRDRAHVPGHAWRDDGSLVFSSSRSGVYALWQVAAQVDAEPEPVLGPAVRDPGSLDLRAGRLVVSDWAYEINLWRSVDGAEPDRVVASTLWDRHPALSPDGRRLAFVSNRTGPTELWTSAADGLALARLTDLGGAVVEAPQWSPDGRQIAVVVRGETASVFVVSAEGGPLSRLTDDAADDHHPRWSRDGRSVLVGSQRDGETAIWRVPVDGTTPERVTAGLVAEDAGDDAFVVARADGGLWRVAGDAEREIAALGTGLADWTLTDGGVIVPDAATGRYVRLDLATGQRTPLGMTTERLVPGDRSVTASADGRVVVVARADRVEADLLVAEPVE